MYNGLKKEIRDTIEYFNQQARALNIKQVKPIIITDKLVNDIANDIVNNDYVWEMLDNEIGDTIKSHIARNELENVLGASC